MFSKVSKLESLVEAVPALVGMDTSGVIRFVNQQSELLFGYERADLVGRHVETLVPDSLWHLYVMHRDDYFADPRTWDMGLDLELRGRHRDGTEFPLMVSLSGIDTGDILLEFTAVSALTRRKHAFDQAQRMIAIVENCDDAIVGSTLGAVVTSWNPGAERLYGYSSSEMIGRSGFVLEPPERAGEMAALVTRLKAGQSVEHFETVRVRKDGSPIRVSLNVSAIRDEEGVVVGVSEIVRDMTQAIKAFGVARSMIESSLDSLVAINPDGMITDVNEATVNVTGVPREELVGTAFSDCFTDPKQADRVYQMVFEKGMAVDYPLVIRRRDGTLTAVLYNASVYRDGDGNVLGVFAAARDVSEARAAFEAARSMIESSLDSLVAINPDGMITDVNEATVNVTGVPREELVGTAFSDYFTDPEQANAIYQLVFEKGMAVDYPLVIRRRDGTLTAVLYNASVYRDSEGNVLGVFAAARDVSEARAAFEAARSMIESSLDSLVAISPEGMITDVNEATVNVTGVPREELVGTAFSDYFTDPGRADRIYQLVFEKGMAVDYPLSMRHRDGTLTEVLYNASVYRDAGGNVLGAFAAARDVTEQMQAQRENAQQQAKERVQLIELQQFQRLTVGRELKITQLKKENERLRALLPAGGAEASDQR